MPRIFLVEDDREIAKNLTLLLRSEGFTVEELAVFHGLVVQAGKDARREGSWEGILRA